MDMVFEMQVAKRSFPIVEKRLMLKRRTMNLYLSDVEKFGQRPQTYLSKTSGVPLIEEASSLSCN